MAGRRMPQQTSAQLAVTRQLRAAREAADWAMRVHAKGCYQCSKASSITASYCDEGWQLAKARARAISAWNKRDELTPRATIQQPLF